MFNTIKAKLVIFSIVSIILICISVTFSYLIAIASIKNVMRTDISSIADTLESNINYIASVNPTAYKDDAFKKMIYSMKIGKSGIAFMINPEGTLVIHPNPKEEGLNKKNANGIPAILANKGSGLSEYVTQINPPQEKIAAYRYIRAWDMWVVSGVNTADYYNQLKTTFIKWNLIFLVIILMIFVAVSTWISRTLTRPLKGLLRIFKVDNDQAGSSDKETKEMVCRLLENLLEKSK